ncbi:MAG: DNA polymerase III subunit delta' [Herpetosiphon sp.]
MSNWGIIGHEWAVQHLRRSLEHDRLAHAYLLRGPRNIGKALLARRLAQRLVCETVSPDPCGTCRGCRRVLHGNHPDVRTMSLQEQASAGKETTSRELKIDTIRAWQHDIDVRPFEAPCRVFILDDAETLTDQAANALLKTLEEPPPYAVLLLLAQGDGDLLPTIESRCQSLKLRPLPRGVVAAALRERATTLDPAEADLLAAWSGGRIGWALHVLDAPGELDDLRDRIDRLAALHAAPLGDRFRWAEERAKEYRSNPMDIDAWLSLWQTWWRDILLYSADYPTAATNNDRGPVLAAIAATVSLSAAHAFLRRLATARQQLRDNVNPQLVFEHLVLHLPGTGSLPATRSS